MKQNWIITLLIGCTSVAAVAQERMRFAVEYKQLETVRGELYQYSERYLGTKDVIKENTTTYRIESVSRIPSVDTMMLKKLPVFSNKVASQQTEVSHSLPLSEETMMTSSTAKKAESVAKQIYRLREARINILSGEADHVPSDGKAVSLVLKEIDRLEKELTSMFLGSTKITTHLRIVYFEYENELGINDGEDNLLCRFSKYAGLVANDDLSGEPVTIQVYHKTRPLVLTKKQRRDPSQPTEEVIETRLQVKYDDRIMYEETMPK